MRLFRSYHPNDVLYLMPVRLGREQLPRNKVRMLFCDAKGKLHAPLIGRSVYKIAREYADKMELAHRNYATLGLEISLGNIMPLTVEIGAEEVWALEHILEHALKKGIVPDVLKKYPKRIIKLGEARRKELLEQNQPQERRTPYIATPRVLNRLPYYPEDDIEVSIPIYKAEHRYPLIILKLLPLNERIPQDMRRLLVLDSDGDLAIIKLPSKMLDKAERDFAKWKKTSNQEGCLICAKRSKEFFISYMIISEQQRKALDTIARYFEKTGYGKQPVPTAAQSVLAKAKNMSSSLHPINPQGRWSKYY